jgi:hypothetical protein
MKPRPQTISHNRLFEAAEAVAIVLQEAIGQAGVWVKVDAVLETARLRERLPGFSTREMEEATAFLIRLGVIEVRDE